MVAAASPLTHSPSPASPRSWSPSDHDHLIFQWVKLEGKSQSWVASQLNINQATVSRLLQRYERWQAHAQEREGGRLDHSERLRAQRWLTYERNEVILASCLRIAQEMEGFTDVSKSTISHPASHPRQETEVRTQHSTIDRTGMVARFLRLAFRINMEQLKLAELDPPPPATPLSDEELAAFDRDAAAAAAELQKLFGAPADSSSRAATAGTPGSGVDCAIDDSSISTSSSRDPLATPSGSPPPSNPTHSELISTRSHAPRGNESPDALRPQPAAELDIDSMPADPLEDAVSTAATSLPDVLNPEPRTLNPCHSPLHNLHNLHNHAAPQTATTPTQPCTCASQPIAQKNPAPCITDPDPPPAWAPPASAFMGASHRAAAEAV